MEARIRSREGTSLELNNVNGVAYQPAACYIDDRGAISNAKVFRAHYCNLAIAETGSNSGASSSCDWELSDTNQSSRV